MSFLVGGKKPGTMPKDGVVPAGMCSLVIKWKINDPTNNVSVQGSIAEISECYKALYFGLKSLESGKSKKIPADGMNVVLFWERNCDKVSVSGSAVDNLGECVKSFGVAQDLIRKHNELNNGYLRGERIPNPGDRN